MMTGDTKHSGHQVLVVDEDRAAASSLARTLSQSGFVVGRADNADDAVVELSRAHYHAALVDLRLGDGNGSGKRVLTHALALQEPPAVVMMSGNADVSTVVAAMRDGAADFLEKPVERGVLVERLERVLLQAAQRRKLIAYEEKEKRSVAPARPVTNAMRDALLLADRVAATPSSGALLVGESGAGKEVFAARIHEQSRRRSGPFVRVNVAAISSSMFEAELFGSVKGAYTDSKTNRAGYLASADGGTILLDEIGELRIDSQPKLLRVLESRRFFPVGSDRERSVDVRVIAATNRDPEQMLRDGLLRPDLFYRLGAVIKIPPLRERPDEILPLAEHFVSVYCLDFGRSVCRLSPRASTLLRNYAWPGNVRQLRNAIERAIMLTEGDEIHPDVLDLAERPLRTSELPVVAPPPVREARSFHRLRREASDAVEREQIMRALQAASGSRVRAARILGLSRSTLYEKLKRYKLEG